MADPQVIIANDVDIYSRGDVNKIINVVEEKTFARDKLINTQFNINVRNYDNFYSVDSPNSYFQNTKWRYNSLIIKNQNGDTIWDGIIRNITRDHENGTANILTIAKLHKQWNKKLTYTSSTAETPATAAKNIMDTYSISYDAATIQNSIDVLDAAGCYVIVNITEDDSMTIMAAIEKLSEYACADAYTSNGNVFFKHWKTYTGGVKVNILEKEFKSRPVVSDTESELINQFQIFYKGDNGTPVTDTNNIGQISRQDDYYGLHELPSFSSSGEDAQIYFTSKAGAQYIGECYIKRTHIDVGTNPRPPWMIEFELKGTQEDWIDLETYFTLTFDDEGWTNKVFELFRTEINYNENFVKLTAIEAQV